MAWFAAARWLGIAAETLKTMAKNKITTETVTLSFDVRLEYQNAAGREHLIASLKRDARVDMGGAGVDTGSYGMKSVSETARVMPNRR